MEPQAPQGQPPQSNGGGLAEVVARIGSDLTKLTSALEGKVPPELTEKLGALAEEYMAVISAIQGGGGKPQQAAAPQAQPPQRGPAPAMGGPRGVPVP